MIALDDPHVVLGQWLAAVRQSMPRTCGGVSYRDGRGDWWCVTERVHPYEPGARCLVFMSDQAVRRVCVFPADWGALTAGELEAPSWGR